jgi:HSP20 family protein
MSNLQLLNPGIGDGFESALRRFFSPAPFELEREPLLMRVDVSEKPEAYHVDADIPGVRKDDIHVRVDGNRVQIDAEVREEKEKRDGGKVLRSERYFGTISRAFSLAQDVDDSRVQARYADGVLSLELPKKLAAKGKSIAVQ